MLSRGFVKCWALAFSLGLEGIVEATKPALGQLARVMGGTDHAFVGSLYVIEVL